MSLFTSLWRVWIGLGLVLFFGVPVLSVVSWMVGGFLGVIVIAVIVLGGAFLLWDSRPKN